MNSHLFDINPSLLLLDDANSSNSSCSNNSNGTGNRVGIISRVTNPNSHRPHTNVHRAPLPKYLEDYYSELAQADRAVSAKCNECGTVVKGSLGVTSNFLRHLRQRHPFIDVQNPGRPYLTANEHTLMPETLMLDYGQHQSSIASTSTLSVLNTSASSVTNPTLQSFNNPRQRTQADALLKWLSTDMLPLSLVEETSFQDFCKTLDPNYAKISQRTLNRMLIGTVSNEVMPSIKNALSQVEDGNTHLTVEVWGPRDKETGVFVIRTYYINDQWELRHHTLGLATIETEREETENLLPTCAATLGQYGIDLNKVGTITTGNAWKTLQTSYSNMTGDRKDSKSVDEETPAGSTGGVSSSAGTDGQQNPAEEFLSAGTAASGASRETTESEQQEREKHLPGGAEIRICKTEVASDESDAQDTQEDPLSSEFEYLQAEHLPSVIDALHKVAQKAIDSSPISKRIMSELVNILGYFRRHARWRDELIENIPRKFRGPLKRTWNSKIDLLQWYAEEEVFNAVISCLSNAWNEQVQNGSVGENPPNLPTQESFYDCRAIYTHVFSPLSEAVDTLQSEGTLASLVIPAMCGIVQAIWTVKEREEVKRVASLANNVIQGIDYGRCKNIREHDVFILATILDPRFKLTAFPDECAAIRLHDLPNRKEAIKILREAYDSVEYSNGQAVVSVIPSSNDTTNQQVDTSGAQGLANKKIFSFYIDRPIKKPRQETEVDSYLDEDANPTYNPLSYWKLKESTWPRLAIMAKKVLSIPTGQESPNRLLNSAKDILNSQRLQIDLGTMENMILYREHVN